MHQPGRVYSNIDPLSHLLWALPNYIFPSNDKSLPLSFDDKSKEEVEKLAQKAPAEKIALILVSINTWAEALTLSILLKKPWQSLWLKARDTKNETQLSDGNVGGPEDITSVDKKPGRRQRLQRSYGKRLTNHQMSTYTLIQMQRNNLSRVIKKRHFLLSVMGRSRWGNKHKEYCQTVCERPRRSTFLQRRRFLDPSVHTKE